MEGLVKAAALNPRGTLQTFALWLKVGQGHERVTGGYALHGIVTRVLTTAEEKRSVFKHHPSLQQAHLPYKRHHPHDSFYT